VQIGNARLFLYKYALVTETKLNEAMDSAFDLEQSFTNTIASLAPSAESGEKLMPGAIYVLVAAMAGSILSRNRNILLRASFPLALGISAGWVVLPVTMRNISDLTWQFEQKAPVVAQTHLQVREGIEKGLSFARVHGRIGAQYVDDKVTDARETVEGWVKKGN
jgi:MICOS complex subunit MIC26